MITGTVECKEKAETLPEASEITNKAEDVCPVDWALSLIQNTRREACGKATICRDGLWQIELIIKDIVSEKGASEDLELLKELLGAMITTGCEYSAGAAALVLASIETHYDEWDIHIRRKRCSALMCRSYYSVHVDPAKCQGAGVCIKACPEGAISGGEGLISVINADKCTRCGKCLSVCPGGAIAKAGAIKPKTPEGPVPVGSFDGASEGGRRRRRG